MDETGAKPGDVFHDGVSMSQRFEIKKLLRQRYNLMGEHSYLLVLNTAVENCMIASTMGSAFVFARSLYFFVVCGQIAPVTFLIFFPQRRYINKHNKRIRGGLYATGGRLASASTVLESIEMSIICCLAWGVSRGVSCFACNSQTDSTHGSFNVKHCEIRSRFYDDV